jgi:serine/threonine protein kinase
MSLTIGQKVKAEIMGVDLTIQGKLGEGGQGTVYLIEGDFGKKALKWYNSIQSTDDQKSAIRYLVQKGSPKGLAGQRFIWPLDLVMVPDIEQFGYLMPLIDTSRFAELGEVQSHLKPSPGLLVLCEISYQTANSYRALHLSGHCYRDISAGNLMFDPISGDVLICDNDNVGVNRQSTCQVVGTMEYMAPEIVKGESQPSTETDLHSLAVLLFNLWVWHHPMHGKKEYQIRSWDLPAKKMIYGEKPVFIFDPNDTSNQLPNDPEYSTAKKRWEYCPKSLRELFVRAFTVGLKEPSHRVTEGEWQGLFLQLKDGSLKCPNDQADNLWEPGQSSINCWHCKKPIQIPPKLVFTYPQGKHYLLLSKDAKLLERHIDPSNDSQIASTVIGEVAQNPSNPRVWGIRNLSQSPWITTSTNGATIEVLPQKSAILSAGLKLNIKGITAEIIP